MTGADRMQKLLARAEAENATLKDEVARLRALLVEWEHWAVIASINRQEMTDENYDKMNRIRSKQHRALKR